MYRERPSRVPGAVVWERVVSAAAPARPVLPDGCMDLIWSPHGLLVAGPDTVAHLPETAAGDVYIGLRFAPGTAPAILDVPAHELRDQRVPLADLWPAAQVRVLAERLHEAPNPGVALEEIAAGRLRPTGPVDPVVPEIVRQLRAGTSVAATAAAVGLSERQLHRRCLSAFGYGPKTLQRILRMRRALALARRGVPFAAVAAAAGYSDQAHLAREVRALAGMPLGQLVGSGANRSTLLPSGSRTIAYR